MKLRNLDLENLFYALSYNEHTGEFRWNIRSGKSKPNSLAGSLKTNGYIAIQLFGYMYQAHRLAWFYFYGSWPKNQIDHINGIKNDNRIENLRDVTSFINQHNQTAAHRNSNSGALGVSFDKNSGKWKSQININGKKTHIGLYNSKEEAHNAYISAKIMFHEGCVI